MYYRILFMATSAYGLSFSIARICRLRSRINLELFFVLAIIAAAMTLAITYYMPTIGSAKVASSLAGASFSKARIDAVTYFAHHGVWPRDNPAALSIGLHENYKEDQQDFVQETIVSQGAFNLHLARAFAGNVLTVRPALPAGENDTVIWVCGNRRLADEWTLIGEDQTTVDERYINRHLW